MASGRGLNAASIGGIEVVAADDCTPRSDTATELSSWLAKFWKRTLGTFVSVVLVDTSGSMPHGLLPAAIRHIQGELKKGASPETVIATFSDSTRFYSPQALEDGSINLRTSGGTALARAVGECRKSVDSQYPDSAHYSIHVLTDLEVSSGEIEDLLRWAASERTSMRVYTWPSKDAEKHVSCRRASRTGTIIGVPTTYRRRAFMRADAGFPRICPIDARRRLYEKGNEQVVSVLFCLWWARQDSNL
jgi:hypothetical protein